MQLRTSFVYAEPHMLVSCTLTVVEESAKAATVEMIQDRQQETLIKLKGCGKLKVDRSRASYTTAISDQKTLVPCTNKRLKIDFFSYLSV